jgi:hypothetical protein
VLRTFLTEVYPLLVDTTWKIENGRMLAPDRPGIGAQLTPEFVSRAQTVASSA